VFWVLAGLGICGAIVMAGRAHSRYLDALEDKFRLSPARHVPHFELVCRNCAGLGIRPDFGEGAPASTIITCSACSSPRGTLGALQSIASSNRRDLFEG
jgi:hypothetical protein